MSPRFLEEDPKWSVNFLDHFLSSWLDWSHPKQMGSPLLSLVMISSVISALLSSSGLRISDRSFGGASFRLLIHKIPEFLGLRNSQKDCFAIASDVPGNSITAFCCSHLETKKVFSGCLTSIRRDFKCSHISSCSVRRRGKNRGNRRICQQCSSGVILPTYLVTQ